MSDIHVLCTRNFSETQLDRLRGVSDRLVVRQVREIGYKADALTAALTPETQVLYTTAPPKSLDNAPNLRWIQVTGAGIGGFRDSPVWGTDIALTTASGVAATTIGEHVLMMMLALSRRLPHMVASQQKAEWSKEGTTGFITRELRGSTVAIVGYGSIGREAARLAHSFGMRVLAVKRAPDQRADTGFQLPGVGDPDGSIPDAFYGTDALHEALAQADYVVLALPSTRATQRLIDADALAAMPPHACIINVGRGDALDHDALAQALKNGALAGAALDVTEPEPLPSDSPLWQFEQVIISPHVAGPGPAYVDVLIELFAANLRRFVDGEPLYNRVDYGKGY